MNLQQYRPTTLAAMIADTSNYLAEQYDGSNVISAQEWDALWNKMWNMIFVLFDVITDPDERDAMLMEAGADPAVIYEGAPA